MIILIDGGNVIDSAGDGERSRERHLFEDTRTSVRLFLSQCDFVESPTRQVHSSALQCCSALEALTALGHIIPVISPDRIT